MILKNLKLLIKMDKHINVEGIILPNVPLTNFQLIKAAKKLKIKNFRGVFVRDELPKNTQNKECGILNTGDSSTNGFHWICWYKDGDEKLSFDSYALPP
ncbi:TPA_asm: adenain [Hydra adintovirus]|nr:TPA_asm: adenain [Hydra adintovirus]